MKWQNIFILSVITLIGGCLRFINLGDTALWIDEAWFGFLSQGNITQEFIPAYIVRLFGWHSEFWLRFQSALFGTLTIPAVYYVIKKYKLYAALLVAVFPLFIFWSRMARPYAVAGFFLVLSWRWWWIMFLAVLTTPIALVGIIKQKWYIIAGFTVIALIFYFIREDSGRNWTIEQVFNSPRWFYLPFLTGVLLVFDIVLPYFDKRFLVSERSNVRKRLAKRKKR